MLETFSPENLSPGYLSDKSPENISGVKETFPEQLSEGNGIVSGEIPEKLSEGNGIVSGEIPEKLSEGNDNVPGEPPEEFVPEEAPGRRADRQGPGSQDPGTVKKLSQKTDQRRADQDRRQACETKYLCL